MSFTTLKKAELLKVAEHFGVEANDALSGTEIMAALASAQPPVTWKMYKEAFSDPEPVHEEKPQEETTPTEAKFSKTGKGGDVVLIKMVRGNRRYETCDYTF